MSDGEYGSLLALRDTLVVSENARRTMRANRGKETGPERALRSALRAEGLTGYRKNVSTLPGRPDVVIPRLRVVIFVHGCFWHGCERCGRNLKPTTNARYWKAKIAVNQARDARHRAALEELGYEVITIWECELPTRAPELARQLAARWQTNRLASSAPSVKDN